MFGLQLLDDPIDKADEQIIPQVFCPTEVPYLKSPKPFCVMLGTGGKLM